jgi:CDP-diacylglycerol--glycerol-3-phosphate 3-phosphatidyltransferase
MLNLRVRPAIGRVTDPVGRWLAGHGVTADQVTFVGTAGVAAGALWFYPQGDFLVGTLVVTAFIFSDLIDGAIARVRGSSSTWGAFLDSTLDRVGDVAIFGGLLLWFAGDGDDPVLAGVTFACLGAGVIVSYAKARAEGLGLRCEGGLVERAERLLIVLFTTFLDGVGVPYVQAVGLWVIAVGSVITVVQRMLEVHRQASAGS